MTRPRQPPLESLRVLEACVRHQNFTRAADELGITPAAVSLRMRDLEAELGTILFERSGPRLRATDAAKALALTVGEALRAIYSAVESCREPSEPLRLTTTPIVASWLAPRLHRYHARPDAAALEVDAAIELRPSDSFDMAIRSGDAGPWPGFEVTPFVTAWSEPMLSPALASRTRLASPADLTRLPLLPNDDWDIWFAGAGIDNSCLHFVGTNYPTYELDAAASIAGTGVALLPSVFFAAWLKSGELVQPFAGGFCEPEEYLLLVRKDDRRPGLLGLRSWLIEEISQDGNPLA